jgi:hypothetical protein
MKKTLMLSLAASLFVAQSARAAESAPAAAPAAAPAEKAEKMAPVAKNDAPGSLKKGNELLDAGKFEDAAAYFDGIGAQSSNKREPYRLLGLSTALLEAGKYDEAGAAAQKAIDLKGDLSGAWNNLAASQSRNGKRDEAIATFNKGIETLKAAGADTSKLEANLAALNDAIEAGKPKKVKEAEAKAKAAADKAAADKAGADKAAADAKKPADTKKPAEAAK